jgi:hypothetical protein
MDDATGRDICEYHNPDWLDYLTFFADAERREKLGQRQIQCPDCKRWFWRHELGEKPRAK